MTSPARPEHLKTHIPPLDHALKASMLQADLGLRMANTALGAARLLAERPDTSAWGELWAIGEAARRRLEHLQRGWIASWFDWARYAARIEGADTLSKLSERELNILNQAAQLVSEQSVELLTLFENVEVDVLYWVSERTSPPATP
jgi:hypothetical protein